MHTSCISLSRAAGSRLRPHRYLITIQFAACGAGSSAPPAAAFRICAVAVPVLFRSALSRCHVSRLGDPSPASQRGPGPWVHARCPSRGDSRDSPSAWSQPQALPPPPCLRQVPSHPWAILLHPGRRVTHRPCHVAVRTRGRCKAARSVPAQDGSEVFLMRQRPQSQGAQGQRRASAFPGTRLLKAHYTVQRQSLPKRQSKIKPPACIAQIRAAPDLSETPSSPMRGCRARLALPPSPRVGRGSAN